MALDRLRMDQGQEVDCMPKKPKGIKYGLCTGS